MAEESDATIRRQMLGLIVEKRPVTASSIAKVLGLTAVTVRRHITLLLDSKEIAEHEPSAPSKRDRGRSACHYVATKRAYVHLADGYPDLASRVLEYLDQLDGHEAVESFATTRSREIGRRYAPTVCDTGSDPQVHTQTLANTSTQSGYAATVCDINGGILAVQLCQGHCPIQNVAGDFPQLCDAKTLALGKLLDAHVQRFSALVGGGHVYITHTPVGTPVIHPRARNMRRKQHLVGNERLTQQ